VDYEYQRKGTANLFLAFEPLANRRDVQVTERRTKKDWAAYVKHLVDGRYKDGSSPKTGEQLAQRQSCLILLFSPDSKKQKSTVGQQKAYRSTWWMGRLRVCDRGSAGSIGCGRSSADGVDRASSNPWPAPALQWL
jgi:hypothetical protein